MKIVNMHIHLECFLQCKHMYNVLNWKEVEMTIENDETLNSFSWGIGLAKTSEDYSRIVKMEIKHIKKLDWNYLQDRCKFTN